MTAKDLIQRQRWPPFYPLYTGIYFGLKRLSLSHPSGFVSSDEKTLMGSEMSTTFILNVILYLLYRFITNRYRLEEQVQKRTFPTYVWSEIRDKGQIYQFLSYIC